jgi:polysaccharide export outer membrane protein
MTKMLSVLLGVSLCAILGVPSRAAAQEAPAQAPRTEYRIGPQDVLTVTVFDEADLSGHFTVEPDGTFTYPLIGRVTAAGRTAAELEAEIKRRLKEGRFLKNPQISVALEQYRSQRIFIVGEVRSPGSYPLTGDMSLIEALARAGSTNPTAADEVLIVRPSTAGTGQPTLPGQDAGAEVIRVNVAAIQAGSLQQNAALRDGDTIVVPRAELVYVYGQVKTPGAYAATKGLTVLQALALAGGLTDRGSQRGLTIVRAVGGKKKELKVKLTDLVQPGDTIVVKERIF